MPISNTTQDYTGRTLDLYLSTVANPLTSIAPVVYYSFGHPSRYVAGVQKLIQRYVISLMNSGFPEAIIGANATNIQNASHLFNLYNWEVIAQFRDYQKITSGLPTDEQLQTVQLDSATIAVADNSNGYPGGMVRFRATLSTVAGNAVPFVLPLSIL